MGRRFDNGQTGAAWVFTRSGSVWTQQGGKLIGAGAVGIAQQGFSVALSSDGNTAIVGGSFDDNGVGAALGNHSLSRRLESARQQTGRRGCCRSAFQGFSVALSGDGNTAIVGGYADDNGVGALWVFTRSTGVWSQQGNKLVGIGFVGTESEAFSVALSVDGNTAVLGGDNDNGATGAALVFTRSGGVWSHEAASW